MGVLLGLACVAVPFWILCAAAAGMVGESRGHPISGTLLGFLFGPLGILFAFLNDGRLQCPRCGGRLPVGPVHACMHCGVQYAKPSPPMKQPPLPASPPVGPAVESKP